MGDDQIGSGDVLGAVEKDVDVDYAGVVDAVACSVLFRRIGSAHRALY